MRIKGLWKALCVMAVSVTVTGVLGGVVAAEDIVDSINITVPVACTMSGEGMTSHVTEVANGTYKDEIGTTTVTAFCNDNEGFSIYATGFTNDSIGNNDSNKLVGTIASNNAAIITGTATTAGNPDVSNWAMRIDTDANDTYALSIDNGFSSYSGVPNEYTKIAHRLAGTDIGANAEGSSFTTTYAVYISKMQPADTYSGQVKYTLVHPHDSRIPLSSDLTGLVLRFDEHPDVVSFVGSGDNTYDINFAVKLTVENLMEYLDVEAYGVTNWSQALALIPDFLAGYGITDAVSDMEVIDENQNYVYMNYLSITPTYWENDGSIRETIFYNDDYNNLETFWSHLPVSTGSMTFTDPLEGETVTINSMKDLMVFFFSGAWRGEAYYENNWTYDFFRTIIVYGGDDVTNTSLIGWLSDNASLLRVNNMQNTTWRFNSMTDINTMSSFSVTGQVYNGQYQAYDFDYISTDSLNGVPYWTFYYYDTTVPYDAGDGFVYIPENVNIPEYDINYLEGWYFGNMYNPAGYIDTLPPIIDINGGDDLVNPSFIDWLNENAVRKLNSSSNHKTFC